MNSIIRLIGHDFAVIVSTHPLSAKEDVILIM